jgi:uncharacterized protein with HEPN domain
MLLKYMAKSTYTDYERLTHICKEIKFAMKSLSTYSKEQFLEDNVYQYGVLKMVEIIGEAASYLSFSLKKKYDYIDWDVLEQLRHNAVHEYVSIDYEMIYHNVKEDYPPLLDEIEGVIEMEFGR